MRIFLLMLSLTGVLYCEQDTEFAQKYELVFGEKPSLEVWARKGAPPPRCGCCSNIY